MVLHRVRSDDGQGKAVGKRLQHPCQVPTMDVKTPLPKPGSSPTQRHTAHAPITNLSTKQFPYRKHSHAIPCRVGGCKALSHKAKPLAAALSLHIAVSG